MIPNPLAERYATEPIKEIWSPQGRILLERQYWIAVMRAQQLVGIPIPDEALKAYERVVGQVDLPSIAQRERVTRHDVKARIEEFCDLAGHQHIHKGLTSRDLTENVEQLQVYRSLQQVRLKTIAVLDRMEKKARETKDLLLTGRTHNVAAQPITLGKRLAMFGEELERALQVLDRLIETYPARGLKGAVGTQLDIATLLEGDNLKVDILEKQILEHLGIPQSWDNVGQVYPRSLDFETLSALYQIGASPSSFAKTLRIMAGHELGSEGFAPGQVGSSAMPHKMNSRSCERINGFHVILRGYLTMVEGLAGDQWNEGDVSCSVVRRVALPDSFFAIDGLLETTLVVLEQMEWFPAVIGRENQHYLPFLCTTTFLMEALKGGMGREEAHKVIKKHAIETVQDLRQGVIQENDLIQRLCKDPQLSVLEPQALQKILEDATALVGRATQQIEPFRQKVDSWRERFPKASTYKPQAIL